MTEITTICGQVPGDCYSDIDVTDYVSTPDGPGTVEVLHEHTAEVRLDAEDMEGAPIRSRYSLAVLHLSESAGAMKDV